MKQKLLRLMFLSAILCILLTVGSFATAGSAHAATRQLHVSQVPHLSRVSCASDSGQVYIYTNYTRYAGSEYVDCFSGDGEQYVNLYNVPSLYTGAYTLYWTWVDCNGATHYSVKGPGTWVDASTSPGEYAGHSVMCDIVYLALD